MQILLNIMLMTNKNMGNKKFSPATDSYFLASDIPLKVVVNDFNE